MRGLTLMELLIVVIFAGLLGSIVIGSCGGCGDGSGAARAVEAHGFKDVRLGDHPWWACGKGDSHWNSYEFTAINPAGKPVSGAVCCGVWAKACTVRF